MPHRFDLFDADEDGLAVAALRGFVDLLDGVTGEVVVAYGPLHDALQHCERADDRGSAGACLLEVGRKALDDVRTELRQGQIAEARQDAQVEIG